MEGVEHLMLGFLKSKLNASKAQKKDTAGDAPQYTHLSKSILENMTYMQGQFDGCADFVYKELHVCGKKAAIMMIDNMVDKVSLTSGVMDPLTKAAIQIGVTENEEIYNWLRDCVLSAIDQREVFSYEESISYIMEGFVLFFYDGVDRALVFGLQDFKFRGIDEPNTEKVIRGSREGFVEPVRINMALVRRRMKNANLKFEVIPVGNETKTDVCLAYIKGVASDSIVDDMRQKIRKIDLDIVLASGFILPYCEDSPLSIFQTVGTTERPDTFCGKLNEGRVGIIVDGTPDALIAPYIFVENFQHIDDYAVSHYYATFTRILKYLAFFISIFLPGIYVAVGSFHQALLPSELLYSLAQAEEATPFPLVVEAFVMQLIYEILREAGLRLPKQIGFAVNIVGALLIGEAAVSAGIIGAPMVIIIALTATSALVVPSLYYPGVIMRFSFIILAGMQGFFGMTIGMAFVLIGMCSLKSFGVPFTTPISPFSAYNLRDVVFRAPWKVLTKRAKVQDFVGSDIKERQI